MGGANRDPTCVFVFALRYNSARRYVLGAVAPTMAHTLSPLLAFFWGVAGIDSGAMIRGLWIAFALYWLVSALKRKRTKQRESIGQRLMYVAPLVLASLYLFRGNDEIRHTWLTTRFVPDTAQMQILGVFLTAAGIFVAIWARYHLGTNW